MGLAAEQHQRSEHEQVAPADLCLCDGDAAIEVVLAPRPSTPQWRVAVEPRHGAHAGKLCLGPRAEYRAVVEEDIYPVLDAIGQRPRVIDLHLEHGTRDIVLAAGQRLSLAVN